MHSAIHSTQGSLSRGRRQKLQILEHSFCETLLVHANHVASSDSRWRNRLHDLKGRAAKSRYEGVCMPGYYYFSNHYRSDLTHKRCQGWSSPSPSPHGVGQPFFHLPRGSWRWPPDAPAVPPHGTTSSSTALTSSPAGQPPSFCVLRHHESRAPSQWGGGFIHPSNLLSQLQNSKCLCGKLRAPK